MTFARGSGPAGLVTRNLTKDRQLAALCAIPIPKLITAYNSCMAPGGPGYAATAYAGCDPSKMSRGQLIDAIGVPAALSLACRCGCTRDSLGSLLGQPDGGSFVSVQTVDPNQVQPSIPSSSDFPDIPPPVPPASSGGGSAKPALPPDGFPAAPPFRAGNWKNDGHGTLLPSYFIASGDTWSGLARLYLGGPTRWKELWSPNKGQFPSPDKLDANVFVVMPEEARAAAQALLDQNLAPVAPPSPGAPGSVPGAAPLGPAAPGALSGFTTGQKVAAAAVGVVVVGGIAYAVFK